MRERLEFVDGLRAVAVLSVLAFHAAAHDSALVAASPKLLADLLRQGCHGVDLFFVLSGFCLSYPSIRAAAAAPVADFDVAKFAARRIVRIVPPYYAAIALLLLFSGVYAALGWRLPIGMPQTGYSAADIVRQALFFDWNVRLLNDVFWTLAVEFRWYFVFPVALWLWFRSPRAFAAAGVAVLCATAATRAGSMDLAVLPTFMLGIVAAHAFVHQPPALRKIAPFAFAVCFALTFATSQTARFVWSASALWGITAFWFVVTAGCIAPLRAMLSLRFLTVIGFTSYGIYLVHEPFRSLTEKLLSGHLAAWPLWLASMAGALVAGMAFSAVAELPFVRAPLRGRLIRELEPVLSRLLQRAGIGQRLPLDGGAQDEPGMRSVA